MWISPVFDHDPRLDAKSNEKKRLWLTQNHLKTTTFLDHFQKGNSQKPVGNWLETGLKSWHELLENLKIHAFFMWILTKGKHNFLSCVKHEKKTGGIHFLADIKTGRNHMYLGRASIKKLTSPLSSDPPPPPQPL